MKEWFLALTQREKNMVQIAASAVVVFLLYLIIIEPISSSYTKNKKNVETATQTLDWMRASAKEVIQLRGGRSVSESPKGKQFVLSTVDKSARKAGLAGVMKRVQPEGEMGVRVWFENAAFDVLINWLSTIEKENGLIVNEINVEQTETTGLVNVRVYLES